MDLDGGARTGATLRDEFWEKRRQVEVVDLSEVEPGRLLSEVKRVVGGIKRRIGAGQYEFEALAIDSLTSLGYGVIKSVAATNKPTTPEWGLAISEIQDFCVMLKNLPIPVFLTAHQSEVTIGEPPAERTFIKLGIYGKNLPSFLIGAFTELWYAKVKQMSGGKVAYVLQTRSTSVLKCRTRLQLPDDTNMDLGLEKVLETVGYNFKER